MPSITEQKQRIADIETARYITGTLRDIAAVEIKTLRDRFLTNDAFYTELGHLYQLVMTLAESAHVETQGKTGDNLYIAYTTNRHFFGALNHIVIERFMKETGTDDRCLIIGDTGRQIWLSRARKRKQLSFLSFESDMPTPDETKKLLADAAQFGRVYVFYPGFVSVFEQSAQMVDISYRPEPARAREATQSAERLTELPQYLLEPELADMLPFFNTQVRYALFERVLLETELSRVAARLVKMDMADQNANRLSALEHVELRRAFSSFSSMRMLETLVGYLQWHKQKVQPIVR